MSHLELLLCPIFSIRATCNTVRRDNLLTILINLRPIRISHMHTHTQLQHHSSAHCHTQMHTYLLQSLHSSVTTRFTTQQFFFLTPAPYRVNMHTDVLNNTHTHTHRMLTPYVLVFSVLHCLSGCCPMGTESHALLMEYSTHTNT